MDSTQQALLNAVLQWSIREQQAGGPESVSSVGEVPRSLDADKRVFLEKVLKSLTQEFTEKMERIMAALKDTAGEIVEADKAHALEELCDIVEDIDQAMDFAKLGGINMLVAQVRSGTPTVQSAAADVLATLVQNNPLAQRAMADAGALFAIRDVVAATSDNNVGCAFNLGSPCHQTKQAGAELGTGLEQTVRALCLRVDAQV